jgi:AcrR family transcriptional regulator
LLRISLEERKDFISQIATKVFSEKGYQTASLQDVAQEAKISKAGMYHYFKSKEEILARILLKNSDQFLAKLRRSVQGSGEKGLDPQESFKKLIKTYAQHVNSDKDKRLVVLRERHQLTGKYKKELFKREQAMFRLIKEELQRIQGVNRKINRNVIAFLFISMSHWLGYWYKEGKNLDLDSIIDQTIWVIFNGILTK